MSAQLSELLAGPRTVEGAATVRELVPELRPQPLGLRPSVGLGDRTGLATPGHVRALRSTGTTLAPIFAQQSIREMERTGRGPGEVMADATWALLEAGWDQPFGADADHLKTTEHIDRCLPWGYTLLHDRPRRPRRRAGAVGAARRHAARPRRPARPPARPRRPRARRPPRRSCWRRRPPTARPSPTSRTSTSTCASARRPAASSSRSPSTRPTRGPRTPSTSSSPTRCGAWASSGSASRRASSARSRRASTTSATSARWRRTSRSTPRSRERLGPYKLSVHSGSDKFSAYPAIAEATGGVLHLKTAGTSYLEALRAVALPRRAAAAAHLRVRARALRRGPRDLPPVRRRARPGGDARPRRPRRPPGPARHLRVRARERARRRAARTAGGRPARALRRRARAPPRAPPAALQRLRPAAPSRSSRSSNERAACSASSIGAPQAAR